MFLEKYRLAGMPPARFASIKVDPEKCVGCNRCVISCPIQLIEVHEKKARSNERYDQFRCLTCENCVVVCPNNAITIEGDYRVSNGFWKNTHLFKSEKTPPSPLGTSPDVLFETYANQLTEVEKTIYLRRSNRLYKRQQVEPRLIERIIEAGRFAPSAGNNQPWKFIVIQNQAVLDEINNKVKKQLRFFSKLCLPYEWLDKQTPGDKSARLKIWQRLLLSILVHFVGGDADQRAHGGLNAVTSDPSYHSFFHAPTIILLLVDKRAIGGTELDMGICAQNMVLAAHSLQLGTCYVDLISKMLEFDKKFSRSLGVTPPFIVATTLAVGYPKGKIDGVVRREKARIDWIP